MKRMRIVSGLLAGLAVLAASPAAQAIVAYSDATSNLLVPGAMGGAFDGVGKLSLYYGQSTSAGFIGNCSATLLAGGTHVLTAGHCVNSGATKVSFQQGAVTRNVVATHLHPSYSLPTYSDLFPGSDLAVLKLDSPVTTIQGFQLAKGSTVGQTALLAGYGRVGNGTLGATDQPDVEGALAYYGYNTYDVLIAGAHGHSYAFDFDLGTSTYDTSCVVYNVCDLGLGEQEAATAFGDSGGGGFVWDGSQWLLSSVHSVGYAYGWMPCPLDPSQMCPDTNSLQYSYVTFGAFGGDVAVFSQLGWISALVAGVSGNTVPEPGGLALGVMGLGALAFSRRRGAAGKSVIKP